MIKHRHLKRGEELLDPDARFLLSNERTFLAWVRTSLAVLAGGIALTQLGHDSKAQNAIGIVVIILGGLMAIVGYMRFNAADKAIRRGQLPLTGYEPLIQAGAIVTVALALIVTRLFGIW
jgi:putative membrane protein